jgi:hypothetical protein
MAGRPPNSKTPHAPQTVFARRPPKGVKKMDQKIKLAIPAIQTNPKLFKVTLTSVDRPEPAPYKAKIAPTPINAIPTTFFTSLLDGPEEAPDLEGGKGGRSSDRPVGRVRPAIKTSVFGKQYRNI